MKFGDRGLDYRRGLLIPSVSQRLQCDYGLWTIKSAQIESSKLFCGISI